MTTHLVLGPPAHGVTRHGEALAGEDRIVLRHVGDDASSLESLLHQASTPIHLHLTDHLLGDDAAAIERGADILAHAPVDVHLTLHDIPQPDEGAARYARRSDVYRRLVALAASVQVCSEHERRLLADLTGRAAEAFDVVPLPIDLRPVAAASGVREASDTSGTSDVETGTVGVLGFIHPGKSPEQAIELAARLGRDVVLLGAVGPGHDEYAADLVRQAEAVGITCTITGHLSETEMDDAIAAVGVPIAPYRHVSASGSIGRWIAAGRRPIVTRNPWADELAERAPWALTVIDDVSELAADGDGLDPASTWIDAPGDGLVSTDEAAERQQWLLDHPRIDVVVTHYDDERRLRWVLKALGAQMYPSERLHVVVADDGSPTLPDAPYVVTQPDEGFRAAAARNLGAREGNAPLILFLDGDTVPQPGFVAAMVTAWHEASADARGCGVVVTGRRRHAEFDDAGTVIRHLDDPAWLLDGHARTDDLRAAGPGDWRYVISAVLGMDRALFTRLGGFDEALVGYGGEDWDLGYRAWNAGAALRHAPVAVAWHDGPDAAARPDFTHLKQHEQLALAPRIPQPSVRGSGGVWAQPRVVVRWHSGGMTPSAEYAVLESWLRLGDVAIHGEGPGSFTSPLVGDPRVREGAPDDVVLARAEYVIDLYAPCLLPVDEPLSLLALADDGPVADSFLRVVRMRDVARQSTPDRPLDALLAVPPRPVDGEALLDLESHGRRWWT